MFLKEECFVTEMKDTVLPFLAQRRREVPLCGHDGTTLFAVCYDAPSPRGTVMILHGLNESTEKYAELIYYFLKSGLSVLIYDQRGHGRSPRSAPTGLVYVKRFSDYLKDAQIAASGPLVECPPPYYLFGHSMGGAVAALLLESGEHPFCRAALSSPMIRTFRYPHLPPVTVEIVCRTLRALGAGKRAVFGLKKKTAQEDFANSCALSLARYQLYAARKQEKEYQSGTVTFGWVSEALGVTRSILKKGEPERVKVPVRIYSAERDHLVEQKEQRELASRMPLGKFVLVEGAKHEIYMANDEILHPYLADLLEFFNR